MKTVLAITATSLTILLSGCNVGDPNSKPTYGDSGLPVNCRALVAEAVEGWRRGAYKPHEALESIERNCGRHGYTWGK